LAITAAYAKPGVIILFKKRAGTIENGHIEKFSYAN
jgi:hypothetical protein